MNLIIVNAAASPRRISALARRLFALPVLAGAAAALLASVALLAAATVRGAQAPEPSPSGPPTAELRLTIVLTRHGVRTPLSTNAVMAPYASQAWPEWEVAPGILTPRGNELVGRMGAYYRELFQSEGLLTGDPAVDASRVYLKADSDQRTMATAQTLGKNLVPDAPLVVHAKAQGAVDALFQPIRAHIGNADPALGLASVLGRLGGDPSVIETAYAADISVIKKILYGERGPPHPSPFDAPAAIGRGEHDNLVSVSGPLRAAELATESLLLEYTDGKPAAEVGWGRFDPQMLPQLLEIHELYFDLVARSAYPAQVQGSNLASHILETLEQAAGEKSLEGAIGPPQSRIVIISGHDTNLANLGGLLGLCWWIPGSVPNPVLPGSALFFELWRTPEPAAPSGYRYVVRTRYVSQTLGQMREDAVLSLSAPPAQSPIYVPGASGPSPHFDAPLPAFEAAVRRAINPEFVAPGAPE